MSTWGGHTENLSGFEMDRVLQFLLFRMDMRTREALMAEMPIQYVKLFPSVHHVNLQQRVANRISEVQSELSGA